MSLPVELTVSQVASLLGCHRKEVLRRIEAGQICAYRPTGNPRGWWRIASSELRKYPGVLEAITEKFNVE